VVEEEKEIATKNGEYSTGRAVVNERPLNGDGREKEEVAGRNTSQKSE